MKYSLGRTTVADIANEAGVSRATIYRQFAAGRDAVIAATVADQVDAFFASLADDIAGATSLQELLTEGLMAASRRLRNHELLARVMAVEPEIVLPLVTTESHRLITALADFLRGHVASLVGPEVVDEQCDYLARLFLSCVEAPGSWDLTDRSQVRALVRSHFAPVGDVGPG